MSSEQPIRQWISDEVRAMVHDYPLDVWPEPVSIPTDAQAAHLMRRMLPLIASRIERNGSDDQ